MERMDIIPSYSANGRPSAFKRQILGGGGLALVSTKQNECEDGFLSQHVFSDWQSEDTSHRASILPGTCLSALRLSFLLWLSMDIDSSCSLVVFKHPLETAGCLAKLQTHSYTRQ
jgi:hypothetical protein